MSIKNIWRNIKNFFNGNSDKEKKKKINTDNLNRAVKEAGKVAQSAAKTVERKVSRTPVRNYQKEADRAVNDVLSSFKKTSSAIGKTALREKRQQKTFQKRLEEQRKNRTLSDFQDYGLTRSQLDKVDKTNKDVGKFVGSSVKRQLGGYGSYLGRLTREMQDDSKVRAWNEAVRTVPGFRNKTLEQQRKILKPLVAKHSKEYLKREKDSANAKLLKKTDKLIESGTKDLEELKEGKSKLGKFGIDVASLMLDNGLDMATGFTLPSMFVRGSGQSAYEAEKDGANRKQALLKGTASGAIEVLTEKFTSVDKAFTKTMGKGFADDLVDRTVRKMAGKTTSEVGQKAIYHGGKTLATALGEGLEEMVSEGLDPFVANKIYADAIGKHKEFSPKDVAYAGLLGATSGGAFGGVGQVVENAQINNNKQWNEANYDKIIKRAKQQAEDSQAYKTALVAEEKIKRGEPVTNMQWELMKQEVNRDIDAQESAFDDVINSAQKVMRKNNFVEPIDYVDGQVVLANNTERKHNEVKDSVMQSTDNEGLAEAIADIEVGMATMEATDLFLPEEKENRAIYESITGEILPTTNVETRKYLLDKIGNNLLKSAEEETMYRDDVLQGEQLAEVNHMGPIGQNAFVSGYEKADNKDEYRSLFNHYYRGGRSNLGFETVANMNPVGNDNISIADRFQMYTAGINDATKGETSMASRIAVATNKAKASDIKLMSKVANRLGINIEITDNEGMQNKLGGDKQFSIEEAPNGFYENGKIVINIEADKPLSVIFSHELTHELKEKNPEAYKQFRDFVVEAWKNRDAESLAEEINSKIEHYKTNGVELTEEEAIEEILADSTWELVQNEDIINELCKQNRSLAQSILDAIEKIIEKLKAILTGNVSLYEPRIEKKLYEELGIAEEVAKMWVDGISNQVKNIENKNLTYDKDIKFSIKDNYEGPDGKIYDQVVILDTDIFKIKKNKHKSRSAVLKDFVYEKLAGHKVIAYDGDKPVAIEFARENERVIKDGVDKNHKVIDKLARKKQDRDRHIIVHAKELVEVSKDINASNSENSHQWLDKNGWDYRKVYIVNHRGDILEATLNIANTKDGRKVLYDINKIRTISLAVVATKASRRNIDNSYDKNISVKEPKSKSFSLKEPIEVGDKLIAMHNITSDKLWKALKLGGFPMPSLAVTKAKIGHTNFGDISLLFDKSTIDPEADSRNKVYGADAWTPVFPQIDYKLNEKKADEVYNRANKVGGLAFFNPVNLADTNLKNKVKDVKGDSLVEYFKNNYGLKNMYLAEKGEPVKMLFEEKDRGGDIGKWFAENCKDEVLEYNKIENNPEDETQYVLDNKEKLSEVYANYLRKVKKENEEYITKRINHRPMLLIGVKNGLMKGMDSLEGKKDMVEDIEATEKLIDDKVNQADYEKWLKDLFAGIVEKEGVYNGKDPYTASGNRRSFEKLHYDVTLDNIVQAMIGQADNVRNDSAFFNGLKTIRAVATEDFGSLEDIRNGKNKLRTIDNDNYELLYNNLSDELADIISKIASKTYGSSNDFIKQDAIGMNIADAILEGNTTAEGLKKYLNKYGSKVKVEDTKPLENLIKEVANMPVNMFEAKPERSVRFDEVVGAVVPADIDTDLVNALEEEGIEVSKYESDEDRIDTVNRLADKKNIMFSIKDSMTKKDYYHYGWAIVNKILDKEEIASFLKQIGDLKRGNYYVRNYEGLIIIPVYNKMGMANKLVYTDGRYQNPSIEKILNIEGVKNETELAVIREVILNEERVNKLEIENVQGAFGNGIKCTVVESDSKSYEELQRRRTGEDSKGNFGENKGVENEGRNISNDKKYSLKTLKQDRTLKKLRKKLEEGEAKLKEGLSPEERNRISNENLELLMQIQALETKEQLANAEGLSKEEIEKFENDYKQLEEAMGQMGIKPMEGNIVDVPVITDELIEEYNQKDDISFEEAPTFKERAVKAKQVRTKSVAELEAQIENLKKENERLAQETKLTHGKLPDIKDIKKRVNQYVRELMGGKKTSLVLVDKATNRVEHIYKLIKEGNYEKAALEAYHAAIEVLEEVDFTPAHPLYDEYLALNEYLRTTPIEVSEQDKKNITDFNYIRKEMFGKIRIVNGPGNIDSVYEEMGELFPVFINSSAISDLNNEGAINSIDMFHEIVDLRRGFESLDFVLEEEEFSQLAKEFGNDLIEIAMDTKPKMTVADKMKNRYDSKVKKLKENFDKAIKEANEKMEKKFGDSYKKKIEKELRKDIRKEERIRANEKRDKEIQKLKEKHEKKENKKKDTTEHKKFVTEIEKNLKWLSDRLVKPTDDKHIPEEFRKLVAEFLYGIDRQTARSKKLQENSGKISLKTLNLQKLQDAYESIAKEDGSGEFEYDGYIADIINATKIKLDGKSIDEADNKTLKDIKTITDALIFQIRQAGKNFNEELRQSREEIAKEIVSELDKVDASRKKKKKNPEDGYKEYTGYLFGSLDKLLNEDMVTPGDFFELLGGGMNKLYKPLRKGFDKHVRNRQNTREMFAKTFEKYYNKKKPGSKLEKIRQKKSAIRIELENGYGITMTPAQIMSLYCLNKREQARGHIYGAGIVASGIESSNILSRSIGGRKKVQAESMQVTPTDVSNIISKLTDEQKAIADALMEYLNTTCADWGNEASMKLFGYKKFTEKNYFPIKSADVYLNDNLEARQIDEVIKNFGFTKGTVVKANNPIVIADIFEVVADHVNKMSLYNAFAVPIADFQRIYNYNIKNEEGLRTQTVRSKLKKVYGEKPEKYIKNFMVDLNNNNATKNRDTGFTRLYNKALANYKKAAIGFNLRVLVQQPTAIMRAMQYISPTRFVGISNPRKNLKEMREHCPIAAWKSWGYAQTDVARDIEDIMMNNEWSRLDLITMRPYGFADDVTWSMIWSAVKRDVKAKHKDVKVGSDEFWELCNEQASMIFDKTQVVDSPFHKSQIMRDKGIMQKTLSSFMAEPTRTFNMVRTEMTLAMREYKAGEKGKATKRMSRTIGVFLANAALVSAAAAVVDALRGKNPDKDDKEKRDKFELWMLNFFNNFDDNANPLNMIVGIKDIWQLKDGWGTSNMALEGFEALWKNIDNWKKFVTGEGKMSQEELLKETSEALGQVFGIPFKNVFRDLKIFFPEVFAAEKESETASEYNAEKNWFDKALEKLGIDDEFDKWGIRKKKSQAEREEEVINERAEKAQKEAEGLSGTKREQAIWSSVTKNYTNMIKDGDFSTLKKMKQTFEAMGEYKLAERLDEKIESGAKTAFKKSIGYAEESQVYRDFLEKEYGYKEGQFGELLQKSETAKDFQKYAIEGDDAKALQACVDLLHSGATEDDLNIIWNKRTKNINAADYAEGSLSFPTSGEISSPFGNRTAPTAGASTYHKGIDISAPSGTDVTAADGGKVSRTGFNNTSGNWIKVLHGNGRYTVYRHLNDTVVLKGDIIKKGQVIGHVGSTGNSTGPHLHFELIQDGQYLDPTKYL